MQYKNVMQYTKSSDKVSTNPLALLLNHQDRTYSFRIENDNNWPEYRRGDLVTAKRVVKMPKYPEGTYIICQPGSDLKLVGQVRRSEEEKKAYIFTHLYSPLGIIFTKDELRGYSVYQIETLLHALPQ